jgi:hypothetical protein
MVPGFPLKVDNYIAGQKIFPLFMELQGSFLDVQQPTVEQYHKSVESSP